MSTASRLAADPYAELARLAAALPEGYRAEMIDGELSVQSAPKAAHATACDGLSDELGPPFRRGRGGPGGWVIQSGAEIHFARCADVVVPDLAGWRCARLPDGRAVPECADHEYASLAPDWICEVLSRWTRRKDRGAKRELYAREGVAHYWLVEPETQTLEVHALEGRHYERVAVHQGRGAVRAAPFDAVALDLSALWGA